jgi:ribosomal protein S18 acetylase RimI-like enzyme
MTTQPAAGADRIRTMDPATMRRLMLHEGRIHAVPGRELRDLGDAILLHDPVESEPFWNRVECVRWPSDANAFDRRLTETLVLFASLGRQAHIWATPLFDDPPDLVDRLEANGFVDVGKGDLMALADPEPALATPVEALPAGVTIERHHLVTGPGASAVTGAIVDVLDDAFEVGGARHAAMEAETAASLANPWFTYYLVRLDGRPAAVTRRATFEGASYLSSIGTAGWARRRGLGGLVTRLATADSIELGSDWTYLGVFADNPGAASIYRQAGFVRVGQSCPDLLLM